eukprot:3163908-Prymnesium_polylepis.1
MAFSSTPLSSNFQVSDSTVECFQQLLPGPPLGFCRSAPASSSARPISAATAASSSEGAANWGSHRGSCAQVSSNRVGNGKPGLDIQLEQPGVCRGLEGVCGREVERSAFM